MFRLKLKRAWRAFCRRWTSESVKFPVDEPSSKVGVVLDTVDFFIANVEARVAFSLAFLESKVIVLVFLGFIFSIQELQYEDKVIKQF